MFVTLLPIVTQCKLDRYRKPVSDGRDAVGDRQVVKLLQ